MSLTTTNPRWVSVEYPILTSEHHARGWELHKGPALRNMKTGWRVDAVVVWCSLDTHEEEQWIARSARTGTGGSFATWQRAVDFADVTGGLET